MALKMLLLAVLTISVWTASANRGHDLNVLKGTVQTLARQLMLQQLFVEERIRSDGDSGVKQIRVANKGTRSYFADTITQRSALAIHDHSNYDRTVGMGELIAVLNGVEFRTRHNDYKLRMPSRHSKTYNALEDLPFPDVPPSVRNKHTVVEQIKEMREYFRAFKEQNPQIRSDYKNFFKPAMCYLEGGWTTNTESLEEPFHSDRHFLDAAGWTDLQKKIRFASYTGSKSLMENYGFLPTTLVDVKNGTPVYAQWNYRILCHPIKTELGLGDFALVDDIGSRLANRKTIDQMSMNKAARFTLNPTHASHNYNSTRGHGKLDIRLYGQGIIDNIMQEIPGKDNYLADLNDHSFQKTEYDMKYSNLTQLNTGYYHRWFKYQQEGNPRTYTAYRGYSDQNLWTAQTTQQQINPRDVRNCYNDHHTHKRVCHMQSTRYTYAIPLEIIWLTPLYKWNPYDLTFHHGSPTVSPANSVDANGRDGGMSATKAFNGTRYDAFYFTPNEFFKSGADVTREAVGVLDKHDQVRSVRSSGTRIFLPDIEGVGKVRLRYPIAPAHFEGNAVYKEIDALKEMVMNMQDYVKYFEVPPAVGQHTTNQTLVIAPDDEHFQMSNTTYHNKIHMHDVYLSKQQYRDVLHSKNVTVYSSVAMGHQHQLEIAVDPHNHTVFKINKCDGHPTCYDGHSPILTHLP
ncbi:uncharacterized protein LOC110450222 [Mizuhopecten yessoensis]|uniref:Uncharacterized protein n=1 Tax=Mizuhopecten yessoensis TaxID=6573 RepID=A0A210QPH2_MIZYE|nr:uncharacterized protein LOC110450222 [Mizuhopecten yessoensis]OWF50598.1 hypothetical protein KP79_PYT06168 [Mizuhopecten yessoensis]